jgi:hypothetical protein
MRRFGLLLVVLACVLPAAAFGARTAPGDGSLDVSGGTPSTGASGSVSLSGRGVVFGSVGAGAITVFSYKGDGNSFPTINGAKMKLSSDSSSAVYTGTNMRFLFPGGRYKIEIDGTGIDISAVGNGSVSAIGTGSLTADTASFTLGKVAVLAPWGSAGNTTTTVAGGKNT